MQLTKSITERIDAITVIPPEYRGTVLPAPKSCKIELTSSCNYRCAFCTRSMVDGSGDMDRKLYSRLIREMRTAGVDELGLFFIGESFLCSWLPDAIKEAKDVGYPYVFLTTNGSAAKPEKVRKCMEAGLDSLKFSLNFPDEAQFESIAQVSTVYFRKAVEHLKEARRIRDEGGHQCGIYASSIDFDGEQGERMRALVEEVRPFVDEHYWLPLFSMGGASENSGMRPIPGNPGRLAKPREPLPCWSVTTAHLDKDGRLIACCFGAGGDEKMVMADLKEVSFDTGWNSVAFQKLREAHLKKDVRGTPCEFCVAARG